MFHGIVQTIKKIVRHASMDGRDPRAEPEPRTGHRLITAPDQNSSDGAKMSGAKESG